MFGSQGSSSICNEQFNLLKQDGDFINVTWSSLILSCLQCQISLWIGLLIKSCLDCSSSKERVCNPFQYPIWSNTYIMILTIIIGNNPKIKLNMVKATMKLTLKTWRKVMFIPIIQINIQLCSHTFTIWRHYLRLLDQNKYHLTTKHFLEAEEDYYSFSSILLQSIPSLDSEDGLTMNG